MRPVRRSLVPAAAALLVPLLVSAWGAITSAGPSGPPATQQAGQQAGQQPPPAQTPPPGQQVPTFRAGVNFVRVDVIVTDSRGNAVKDLALADFEVFEDGKPQKVETFKLIDLAAAPERAGELAREIRTDSDEEYEAARDDVRLIAVFLDDYHVRRASGMSVRTPLAGFIAKQLAPGDMVALMYPLTPTAGVRFTRNHDSVIDAIERFEGRKFDYRPRNEVEERYAYYPAAVVERLRNQVTLSALEGLAMRMGSLREGRKSIILVSEGFSNSLPAQLSDPVAAMPGLGNPQRGVPILRDATQAEEWHRFTQEIDLQRELRDVYDTANRNNTAIYTLDPRGLAVFEFDINEGVESRTDRKTLDSTIDTLRILADETDGRAIVNRNDLEPGLTQVVRDSAFYYLLGYNSTGAPADGKFHEIKVRVKRSGVQLRARKGYWAPSAEDLARVTAPPKPEPPAPVQRALASIVEPFRGRYIRSWVGTSRGEDGRTRVRFVWEQIPPAPGVEREGAASVFLIAAGEATRPYFRGRVPDVLITDGAKPETGRRGPFMAAFDAPPGALQMRVAVEGPDGRVIDAESRELRLPDFTVPQLFLSTPDVLRAANNREFKLLAADPASVPTANREFRRTERLLVRFEVYAPGTGSPEVTGRLLNRAGTPMTDVTVKPPAAPASTYEIDLPLAGLAPGEYLLEIAAKTGEGEVSELVPLRIVS